MKSARYAFVLPRSGANIVGGAENLSRQLALHLSARGDQVEIFSTCAVDNRTWENELPPGVFEEDGVNVRRFPVDERDLDIWIPKQISISEGMELSLEDQLDWMAHSVNSSEMYACIAKHSSRFDALFFAPYLFGTTFWGSQIAPEKSVLIPCLHDEHYAYLDIMRVMFSEVSGALFNAHPEQELAQNLYGAVPGGVVGMGFDSFSDESLSSLTPYFEDQFPYLLYFGRKETGKNVHHLIDLFCEAKEIVPGLSPLKLVVAGGGSFSDLHRPAALERDDVIDIGFVSEEEKLRLMKHALTVCQPSRNESFSIVIMEAWLVGTPALVDSQCAVTKDHVDRSGGGLYFGTAADLAGIALELIENSELRNRLAAAGAQYMRREYEWDAVLERFDAAMDDIFVENSNLSEKQIRV